MAIIKTITLSLTLLSTFLFFLLLSNSPDYPSRLLGWQWSKSEVVGLVVEREMQKGLVEVEDCEIGEVSKLSEEEGKQSFGFEELLKWSQKYGSFQSHLF